MDPTADPGEPSAPPQPPRASNPYIWVSTTYFAEGFPYTIVNSAAEVLFKGMGASLQAIGLTSLFHLPWNLKFLWGPFLDSYGTKRRWLISLEVVLSAALVGLALGMQSGHVLVAASIVFLLIGILAATHDIAIDGYYLEALDERGRSKYVGLRAAWYRAAQYAGASPLFIVVGFMGWTVAWLVAAAVMIAFTLYHASALPRVETARRPIADLFAGLRRLRILLVTIAVVALIAVARRSSVGAWWRSGQSELADTAPWLTAFSAPDWIALGLLGALLILLAWLPYWRRRMLRSESEYARAFVDFLDQPKIGRILAIVILFRTGESFILKMRYAFLVDRAGIDEVMWGQINLLAIAGGIAATIVGGWLIARHGLRRWLWPFVLAQNILNLLYMALAGLDDPATLGFAGLVAVVTVENVGAGLGTAVFLVYLMRCCDPRHKAAHMAILTALMSLSFTFAGVASGYLADALGFELYFGLSFVATFPAMALLPFAPYLDGRGAEPATRAIGAVESDAASGGKPGRGPP